MISVQFLHRFSCLQTNKKLPHLKFCQNNYVWTTVTLMLNVHGDENYKFLSDMYLINIRYNEILNLYVTVL